MHRLLLALVAAVCALAVMAATAHSASALADTPWKGEPASIASQAQEIDDNDDTRVEVQLAVLAVAGVTVFVLGSAAYLLRRRLGLVAPPPEQGGDGHH
jgi:hypothetical protein